MLLEISKTRNHLYLMQTPQRHSVITLHLWSWEQPTQGNTHTEDRHKHRPRADSRAQALPTGSFHLVPVGKSSACEWVGGVTTSGAVTEQAARGGDAAGQIRRELRGSHHHRHQSRAECVGSSSWMTNPRCGCKRTSLCWATGTDSSTDLPAATFFSSESFWVPPEAVVPHIQKDAEAQPIAEISSTFWGVEGPMWPDCSRAAPSPEHHILAGVRSQALRSAAGRCWAGDSGRGAQDRCPEEGQRCWLPESRGQPVANLCCVQKPDPAEPLCFTSAWGSSSCYQQAVNHVLTLSPPFHTPSKSDEDTVSLTPSVSEKLQNKQRCC